MPQIEILLIQITLSSIFINFLHQKIFNSKCSSKKETVKASDLKTASAVCGIIATCFMIYNYMSPDTKVKTAAVVAAGTSNILNKTNTLFSHGYGDEDQPSVSYDWTGCNFVDQGTCLADQQSCS